MAQVAQEFYCTKSGGGCGGYFRVKINDALNYRVKVICPKCGHRHDRRYKKGIIVSEHRFDGKADEELMPTMGAYSTEPMFNKTAGTGKERDAVVIKDPLPVVSDGKGNILSGIGRWAGTIGNKA